MNDVWHYFSMRVFATKQFHKEKKTLLSKVQREQLERFVSRLKEDEQRGKRLRGKWLCEVKLQEKRAYYIVHKKAALFLSISGKKQQERAIKKLVQQKNRRLQQLEELASTR